MRFINEPVPSNCYVLFDKMNGSDCIVIDPGSKNVTPLLSYLKEKQLTVKYIILTHEHFDHCWGADTVAEKYHSPIVCSGLCAECIHNESKNLSLYYDNNDSFIIKSNTICLEKMNYSLNFSGFKIAFYATPGHTNASVSFTVAQALFTGDTLIEGKRTYTKLPSGSVDKVTEAMKILSSFQGKGYTVYPGHGESFELDIYDLKNML